ncbi:MAG: sigma-70 family RNA polymerase sigma factor [Myxococcales bacterium]|nr:sigma-70 family RNA polymerase sigma factor [Myxococcales bacterium]
MSAEGPPNAPSPNDPAVSARVTENLDLVEKLARSTKRLTPRADFDDLVGAGRMGLLLAARAFDPTAGVPFRAYASHRVRGAMLDHVRRAGNLSRAGMSRVRAYEKAQEITLAAAEEDGARKAPLSPEDADRALAERLSACATAMAMSMLRTGGTDDLEHVPEERDPAAALEQKLLLGKIEDALAERPETEREIVRLHYFEDLTLEEIGARLGLHKSWVCRVLARVVGDLAKRLDRRPVGAGP